MLATGLEHEGHGERSLMPVIVGIRQSPASPEIEGEWCPAKSSNRRAEIGASFGKLPGPNYRNKPQQLLCRPRPETTLTNPHNFSVGLGRSCTARSNKIPVEQSLTKVLQGLTTPLTATARSPRQIATIPRARLPTIGDTRSLSGKAHITARKCKSLTVGRNRVI